MFCIITLLPASTTLAGLVTKGCGSQRQQESGKLAEAAPGEGNTVGVGGAES